MKANRKGKIFSVLVVGLLVLSVLTAATAAVNAEQNNSNVTPSTEEDNTVKQSVPEDMPTLEEAYNQIQQTIKEGKQNGMQREIQVENPEIRKMIDGAPNPSVGNNINTDPHTKSMHKVDQVHDMGISGENVTVSFMDTGFDFAQPDLMGRQARFEYNASTMPTVYENYSGHPIAFDAYSLSDYLSSGEVRAGSWFVDTSYEAEADDKVGFTGMVARYTEKPLGDQMYELPSTVDDGDMVRFGLHPDDALATMYGERPAVLLTKNTIGEWANIYVDLDNDRSFRDEKKSYIGGTNKTSEIIYQDVDGDGIADISGGMAYFISDGDVPLPYSQSMREKVNALLALKNGYFPGVYEVAYGVDGWTLLFGHDTDDDADSIPDPGTAPYYDTPSDGDVVCLMGDFNGPGSYGAHGTWTASAVAGQGVTGVPNSEVSGGSSPYPPSPSGGSGLVQGIAPNVDVIPMGHFFEYPPNGLGTACDVGYAGLFFAAEGYDGNTSTFEDQAQIASSSFGNSNPVNVGGYNYYDRLTDYIGSQYTFNTLYVNSEGNEGSGFGTEGAPAGAQGILSVGAASNQYYRVDPWYNYDEGPNPWAGEVTSMTSRGPDAVGAHGVDILTNGQYGYGGDPLNNHAYSLGHFQGNNSWTLWSGTSLASPIAAGIGALAYQAYMEEHGTRPTGQQIKEFIMQGADNIHNDVFAQGPGLANALRTVKLAQESEGLSVEDTEEWRPGTNPDYGIPTTSNVNMMDQGEYQNDSLSMTNFAGVDQNYTVEPVTLSEVGSYSIEIPSGNTSHPAFWINETGIYDMDNNLLAEHGLPSSNLDLLRMETHIPYDKLPSEMIYVEYLDWTDVNTNGTYDGITERNRIIGEFAAGGPYYPDLTSSYTSVHNPWERLNKGMVIRSEPEVSESVNITFTFRAYNEVTWDWVTVHDGSGTLGAGNSTSFNLNMSVPSDAPYGLHGGKILVTNEDTGNVTTIPTTVTVGESFNATESEYLHYKFGSTQGNYTKDHGIYRNDRVFGSWAGSPPRSGDWRYYYFHTADQTDGSVSLNLNYDNMSSSVEAYLLGQPSEAGTYIDAFSYYLNPMRYGPYQLEVIAETSVTEGEVGLVTEGPLDAGTYCVAVHSKQIAGDMPYQSFNGEILTTDMYPETLMQTKTITSQSDVENMTSGKVNYQFKPGYSGDIVNMTKPPTLGGTDVYNMEAGPGNAAWSSGGAHFLSVGKAVKFTCQNVKKLHIEITEAASPDLDLGLVKDANGNQVRDSEDTVVTYHGIGGSMEYITIPNPADGTYFAVVNTYTGSEGDPFTLEITKSVVVPGIEWGIEDVPSSVTKGETYSFNLTYSLPASQGTYSVWWSLGTETSPINTVVEGSIRLQDGVAGKLTYSESESSSPVDAPAEKVIFNYHDSVFYSPLNADETMVYFNGEPVPSAGYAVDTINGKVIISPYKINSMWNNGDMNYDISVMSMDGNGNIIESNTKEISVNTIDLSVAPLPDYTNKKSIISRGYTTEGASVTINGNDMDVSQGYVVCKYDMENDYENSFHVTAMDGLGNSKTITQHVIYDPYLPDLTASASAATTEEQFVTISGTASDLYLDSVMVDGKTVMLDGNSFSTKVALDEGTNDIMVAASDKAGNVNTTTISVEYTPVDMATQAELDEVSEDVTSLNDYVMDMEESVNSHLTNLNYRLITVHGKVNHTQSRISNMDDELKNTRSQITTLQSDVQNAKQTAETNSQDISSNEDDISGVQDNMYMAGGGLFILLLIIIGIVYFVLNNKINKMSGAPVEEEPMEEEMYEEEEMFEEPEEEEFGEEEMFEEEELGEEEEMFEEEEFEEEEPEDIFEEEEEFPEEEEEEEF